MFNWHHDGLTHLRNPFPLSYTLNIRGVIWWLYVNGCSDPFRHAEITYEDKGYDPSNTGCVAVDLAVGKLEKSRS